MISDGLGLVFRAQFGGGTWGVIAVSHMIWRFHFSNDQMCFAEGSPEASLGLYFGPLTV